MQSLHAIVLTALTCIAAQAQAAESDSRQPPDTLYGGLSLGLSQLNPQENGSGWHTIDSSSTGFSLYLGYPINSQWFAELTYADLGAATVAPRNNALGGPQDISYQVPSLTAVYYFWQPKGDIYTYLRAGVASIINKNSGDTDIYEKNTSAQIALGLGAEWRFAEDIFTRLEITSYDVDAQIISLSIGCWIND
ncbi:MAG TPA: porin family protein [Cellvibrionaceae bacterium]|nr:porin family protein [Cellvibrionaceae bacterium]HMW71515.1 porin family protein [Cellvibrionaceae bacterium]HMY38515.1 porin family protein [Marinagarivorans sp.]HNG61569.1 porin family protein [Cellvibrionaceae bacterium]